MFAELEHVSTGTNTLRLRGAVSNSAADITDVTVTMTLSNGDVIETVPNADNDVTVTEYGPLTVTVKTGKSSTPEQAISRTYDNVYPGIGPHHSTLT